MGIVLDLIFLAILVLSIVMGYKKGIISVLFSLFALILSLVLTAFLYKPISNWVMNNTEWYESLKTTLEENLTIGDETGDSTGDVADDTTNNVTDNTTKNVTNEENETNFLNEYLEKYVLESISETSDDVVEETAKVLAERIIAICVAIVLFIVIRIAIMLLKFIVAGIAELPIIRQFNELGGTVYGILRGLLIIYVALAVMFFIVSVNNSEFIINLIDTSIVSKILYANNIILNIMF